MVTVCYWITQELKNRFNGNVAQNWLLCTHEAYQNVVGRWRFYDDITTKFQKFQGLQSGICYNGTQKRKLGILICYETKLSPNRVLLKKFFLFQI